MSWWPVSMWNGAQDLCIDHTKEMHSKTRVRCLHTPSRMAVMPLGVDEDVQQSDLTRCSWERAALWQYLPKLNRRRNRTFEPSNSSPHCKPERAKCVSTKRSVQAHHCSFDCNCPKGNSPVFPWENVWSSHRHKNKYHCSMEESSRCFHYVKEARH